VSMKLELPAGWQIKTLGLFKWASGGTPSSGVSEYYGGDIPWVIIRDLNDSVITETATKITESGLKNSSAKWVEPGSVLIALYGSIGKAAISGIRLTTNQAIAFTKPDTVDTKYLFYYLKHSQPALLSLGKGATQQNISQSVLKAFPFVLAPEAQQAQIVSKIEELFSDLDAGVAALKRAQANLKRYRAAVLKAAVEGRLTAQWRAQRKAKGIATEPAAKLLERILAERRKKWEAAQLKKYADAGKAPPKGWQGKYPEPVALIDDGFLEIPDGWCRVTVDQASKIIDYRGRTPPYSDAGIPHLRSSNVKQGKIVWEKLAYVTEETYSAYMTRGLPEPGDILFTTEAPLGEVANVPSERFSIAQRLVILQFSDKCFASSFVMMQMMSPKFQEALRPKKSGSTVEGVSSRNFKTVPMCVPPLDEQTEIVSQVEAKLSNIAQAEAEIKRSLERAARLRQAILKRAFEGRLV
jgi:type I restriction enzyme, S subunit